MKLNYFKSLDFLPAIKALLKELKVPFNAIADEPVPVREILKDTYKDNSAFQLIREVYFVGIVDDAAFERNESLAPEKIKSDYDGILFFGVTLDKRDNKRLPTRGQLAEIARAFNREFYYTPVVVIFKYQDDKRDYIAFANTERLPYKQEWREGEKAGKVSLLRDITIDAPHRGHEDIIEQLQIPTSGTKAITNFDSLYKYWQEVFSVSILNKKFYQELSNWYFWAIKNVTFPNQPTPELAHKKGAKLDDLIQEHNATNVIRLLTRLLFTWFIKEKRLIPEALFDLDSLQKDILNEISPYHEEGTMFAQANKDGVYYKAILQNLFFASLNCPIEADSLDNRTRGFRGTGYGTHRGIDYLMRYRKYFKNPDAFLAMMNKTVPFLNGGLFECLDDKYQNLYIDGFSDQMTKGQQLIVPDYLFFGTAEEVDLSAEYGVKNKGTKQAAVKGLINILKSYKFTITENTPIEEDVALDPELLGKVFENLLASYNPETKTTARKQTGSFYTPREIVNYMVDESLIAYLKNAVSDWNMEEEELDEKLHQLTSFDPINPFEEVAELSKRIVKTLDKCQILDPACGSGAFPMGILQKMVHMLQKLDPKNVYWKEVQFNKAIAETEEAYSIEDKKEREEKLIEINNAFDENVNGPDYARKLYLIENCIYGVDIQPIATQIAKLRFFISLVVDQKATDDPADNFNIRPLPNLETKFVTANTLIGIEKPKGQLSIFDSGLIKELEAKLKKIRHKLFSARTKDTKLKYRQKDEELRNAIADELKKSGWLNDTAEKLASWDPYNQNASSIFFDKEWMFDVGIGFDIIITNPPYLGQKGNKEIFQNIQKSELGKLFHQRRMDLFYFFFHFSILNCKEDGIISFITTNYYLTATYSDKLRQHLKDSTTFLKIIDFNEYKVFESAAGQHNLISIIQNGKYPNRKVEITTTEKEGVAKGDELDLILNGDFKDSKTYLRSADSLFEEGTNYIRIGNRSEASAKGKLLKILAIIKDNGLETGEYFNVEQGIVSGADKVTENHIKTYNGSWKKGEGIFVLNEEEAQALLSKEESVDRYLKPTYKNSDLKKWYFKPKGKLYVLYIKSSGTAPDYPPAITDHLDQYKIILINRNIRRDKISISDYNLFLKGKLKVSYIMNASSMQQGDYYCLSYARNAEKTFEGYKIVNSRRAKRNIFSLENKGYYEQSDIVVTTLKDKKQNPFSIHYVLGLLNSTLYYHWFYLWGKRKGKTLELFQKPITETYIKEPNPIEKYSIETLVKMLIKSKIISKNLTLFESILDGVVIELYFNGHMKEREINILEFVERDINQALQGRDFDSLDGIEKEKVIEQFHTTWSDPDNEVRNRIKLFAVRSPEILKPILES